MKSDSLLGFGLVVCAAAVLASGARLLAQAGAGSEVHRLTVIGCLKASGNAANPDVTVVDYRGGPAPTFKLIGDAEQLKIHTGHTMEITGTVGPAATVSGASVPTLKIEKLQWLSSSCWESQNKR